MQDQVMTDTWGFEDSMENVSGYEFKPGINEGVTLRAFEYEEGTYGPQLKVIIGKGETTTTKWWGLSDDRGTDQMKATIARAKAIAFHFVHSYVGADKVKATLQAASPRSAQHFIETMASLLPANVAEIPASCILSYGKVKNGNQYLELPVSMKVTGAFWSVNGSHELECSDRLTLIRETAEAPANEESTDDEDWG